MLKEELKKLLFSKLINSDSLAIFKKNAQPFRELMTYYKCAMMEVETKFNVLNEQFSLEYDRNPIHAIETRIKSPEGIAEKLNRRNLPISISSIEENLFDIAGIRVVCSFLDDIYMLADCLLQQDDITLVQKKDYIKNPKDGGYRSLHLIVSVPIFLKNEKREMKVEVQLRTIAMDFWASIEHKLRYKKSIPKEVVADLEKELLDCAEQSAAMDERMQEIRKKILSFEE